MMIKTAEFADLISSTQKLNGADLDKLQSKEEKVSFFGNLQNLMFIHMCLYLLDDAVTKLVNIVWKEKSYSNYHIVEGQGSVNELVHRFKKI